MVLRDGCDSRFVFCIVVVVMSYPALAWSRTIASIII